MHHDRQSTSARAQTSRALCQRSSGSFARHARSRRSSAGGVIGCSVGQRRRLVARGSRAIRLALALALERPSCPSPSRRAPRRTRRCRCARRRPRPPAARAPCTGTCRGSCPRPVSGAVRGRATGHAGAAAATAGASPGRSRAAWRRALRQHDVGRLQVAMDDALPMRLVERVGDLDRVARAPRRAAAGRARAARPASRPRASP